MNYFDDLRTRLDQGINSVATDFRSYIQDQIVTPTVKIGQAATGNLSEAQIAAGKKAAAPPIVPAQGFQISGLNLPMVLLLAGVGYFLLSKKGRI